MLHNYTNFPAELETNFGSNGGSTAALNHKQIPHRLSKSSKISVLNEPLF
jgi:hypothetical protein